MCNFRLDDLVIISGTKLDVKNVARGPSQPPSLDCFTHALVDGSRRTFPRSVLQADTIIVSCGLVIFERTSWSTQRCHKIWGLRDDLAATTNYDKFLDSFEDDYPGVSDGRSVWMIDYEKPDRSDQDKNLEIHVGPKIEDHEVYFGIQGLPRAAWTSVCENITILLSQERRDHDLQEWTSPFSGKR